MLVAALPSDVVVREASVVVLAVVVADDKTKVLAVAVPLNSIDEVVDISLEVVAKLDVLLEVVVATRVLVALNSVGMFD